MKILHFLLVVLTTLTLAYPAHGAYEGEEEGGPGPYEVKDPATSSGWFMGTNQGVLFFVGDSSDLVGTQYYGIIQGGYSIKGIFKPMFRLGQAIGRLNGFLDPTTFFFIFEAGFKVTPLRTKVRPHFLGSAGFYILDFSNVPSAVHRDTNFTFSGGGGLEIQFGRSIMDLTGAYRYFVNSGANLQGVEITLGYMFQF